MRIATPDLVTNSYFPALAAEELLTSLQAMVGPPTSSAPREPLRPLYEDELGTPIEPLSPRETEVLAEIRLGRTNREIADKLRVSTTTVNKHVHQVLRKLRVRNRAEAAIVAGSLLSRPRR